MAGGGTNPPATEYTVSFVDRGTEVHSFKGKTGDVIVGPSETPDRGKHYEFRGWGDFAEGDKIYSSDITYTAVWYEKFGTDNVYEATKLRSSHSITPDGVKDEAWNDSTPVTVNTVLSGETETTAEVRFMWDKDYLYVFADVKDATSFPFTEGQAITANDAFEMYVDTLHSERFATEEWKAKENATWADSGNGYRPGGSAADTQCEGGYRIGAGAQFPLEGNVRVDGSKGSEFTFEWMSNGNASDGDSVGTTKLITTGEGETLAVTGYTVEYKIKMLNINTKPVLNSTMGVGIKIFDRTAEDKTAELVLESIYSGNIGPKKLSNLKFVENEHETYQSYDISKVRDIYDINVDGDKEYAYVDSIANRNYTSKDDSGLAVLQAGRAAINALWGEKDGKTGLFVHADVNDSSAHDADAITIESINITEEPEFVPAFAKVTLNRADGKASGDGYSLETFIEIDGAATEDFYGIKISCIDDGTEIAEECGFKLKNDFNYAAKRSQLTATQTTADITVDGTMDAAYSDAELISLNHQTATAVSAEARVLWKEDYLYVFVDVKSDTVHKREANSGWWAFDYVEVCVDTWNNLPKKNFSGGDYRGVNMSQGQFKAGPSNVDGANGWFEMEGWIWLNDWIKDEIKAGREQAAAVIAETATGYTAEFKFNFAGSENDGYIAKIDVADRIGMNIGFRLTVSDYQGTGDTFVSTNKATTNGIVSGFNDLASYDQLKLIANPNAQA